MRTYVNNDIYNALPTELQSAIIDTKVVSGHGSTAGETNFTSTDKLYLLSSAEVWEGGQVYDTATSSTRQLDYYKNLGVTTSNYSGAIKQYSGSNTTWWLRAPDDYFTYNFFFVYTGGGCYATGAGNTYGVSPAFRIA